MQKLDILSLIHHTTFITGNTKNAGKTTFLNYLLPRIRQFTNPVILTIGIDGEQQDQIFGNPKPQIKTEIGDYLVTTESSLLSSDALFECQEVFPYQTALGRLVLIRTLRSGYIELVGSETNQQLADIIEYLKAKQLKTILVDGAVSRMTQISCDSQSNFIYIQKISQENKESELEKLTILFLSQDFPLANEEIRNKTDSLILQGALTGGVLKKVPKDINHLIVKDFTKIFLTLPELKGYLKNKKIYLENYFPLKYMVLILRDLDKRSIAFWLDSQHFNQSNILFNPYDSREFLPC
ncbi:MAG: hypothetical protein MJB14_23120 [Spirochaetes bacterium]|nr:hypothetical protein [Spirochaetota bacterium]